ncbi:2-oxo-4-hydroxy-4-carboxy-5-ureidoimidazoline decarboxylase [Alcaligenes sp. WGS1538]|uniref:2-oxo-4-hydroxy-4-carboxy-5-ureidoimidazoline decarboxylase n=1 Tax=Alcaligenes sp. WGS1538 TaxID=3366811 RepID=UPI00372D0AB7
MTQTLTPDTALAELSSLDQAQFVNKLEGIFEHSPWVAERTWSKRPFHSVDELHATMVDVMNSASYEEKKNLICAHPELAGKEAEEGTLTTASTGEQRGAGLDQCSAEELARLRGLNASYRDRFGFPFVIAVKGLTRYQIMDTVDARLNNDVDTEFQACLREIGKIARFRLDALFA